MKRIYVFPNPAACLVICLFYVVTGISNAQVKMMSAKELAKESSAVLYGRCSSVKSEWNENRSMIYTYVTVAAEGYIKGNLGSEAVIAVPGGKVDDILYEVSEMPVFTEGEEVVAFVWTNPEGKNLITGGYQGRIKIEKDEKTGKRMVEAVGLESETGLEPYSNSKKLRSEKVPLDDFVRKVRGM